VNSLDVRDSDGASPMLHHAPRIAANSSEFDVCSSARFYLAAHLAAPEMSPASWMSAVSRLAGALLILRGRRQQITA
jgi:hypothetical protein